ncbi:hypothetical protein DL98DRAFT_539644 [Cadophora sp. DSE1049]|nr:hypothetical protein DL98DRAFT_539644 [Cadophora sp. DSE1049]
MSVWSVWLGSWSGLVIGRVGSGRSLTRFSGVDLNPVPLLFPTLHFTPNPPKRTDDHLHLLDQLQNLYLVPRKYKYKPRGYSTPLSQQQSTVYGHSKGENKAGACTNDDFPYPMSCGASRVRRPELDCMK